MASNLPPGVTEGMIPGNRPIDLELEQLWDEIDGTIRNFVNDSERIALYDIPGLLTQMVTEYEDEINKSYRHKPGEEEE